MSDTIFHEMNNVDPNERVQVGSYRVDGHGHQKLKDVKYFPCFAFRIISIFSVGTNHRNKIPCGECFR